MRSVLPPAQNGSPEHVVRPKIRQSLAEWTKFVLRLEGREPAPHHYLLSDQLEAVSNSTIDRLMVLMPPGSAKSIYSSVNTNLWGAYVTTPATAGTWYAWAEGVDGSAPSVSATAFTVT